jgi:hypothetical protein
LHSLRGDYWRDERALADLGVQAFGSWGNGR